MLELLTTQNIAIAVALLYMAFPQLKTLLAKARDGLAKIVPLAPAPAPVVPSPATPADPSPATSTPLLDLALSAIQVIAKQKFPWLTTELATHRLAGDLLQQHTAAQDAAAIAAVTTRVVPAAAAT